MEAYPSKVRELVLGAYDEGLATKQIAERFKVSRSWARRVRQRFREQGLRGAREQSRRGPAPKFDADHQGQLAALVVEAPDATLAELKARLGVAVSVSTVARALAALRLTFKKSPSTPPSGAGRT